MDWITNLWDEHGALLVPLIWMALSALINILMRKRTAEEWVTFGDKYPRLAALTRILRAAGIDPVKLLISLVQFVHGKALKTTIRDLLETDLNKDQPK
jgi:hypothetical protein